MPGGPRDDDRRLIQACLRGDAEAWDALIQRYRRLIYSVPVAYGLDGAAADDVFQQVAVKLLEHLPRLRRRASLPAWLLVTARREAAAVRRRAARTARLAEADLALQARERSEPVSRLHRIECEHALALAFERLDAGCRELLAALYLEEPRPSYETIAERLKRPVGSLGPTRARCLAKLRRIYKRLGGPEP